MDSTPQEAKCFNIPILYTTDTLFNKHWHCVKSVQIGSFFWSLFSCIQTSKSPYSVRMQENTDHKKLRILTLFTQCGSTSFLSSSTCTYSTIYWDTTLLALIFRLSFFQVICVFQIYYAKPKV